MIAPTYIYRAVLLPPAKQAKMDGDTWWADLDLGVRQHSHWKLRLRNYSCPERKDPGGLEAWEYALGILYGATQIIVQTHKDRLSHDRWIADVWVDGQPFGPILVAAGHALETPMRLLLE